LQRTESQPSKNRGRVVFIIMKYQFIGASSIVRVVTIQFVELAFG